MPDRESMPYHDTLHQFKDPAMLPIAMLTIFLQEHSLHRKSSSHYIVKQMRTIYQKINPKRDTMSE